MTMGSIPESLNKRLVNPLAVDVDEFQLDSKCSINTLNDA